MGRSFLYREVEQAWILVLTDSSSILSLVPASCVTFNSHLALSELHVFYLENEDAPEGL